MKKQEPYFLILAVVLMLVANFGYWLSKTIYNPENFSNLVVQTYEQPDVRNAIASEIVDQTLQSKPLVKQVIGDPVKSAISGILGSNAFRSVLERLATRFQNYLTSDNRQDVTIQIGQVATFIKAAGNAISPELGSQIPDTTPQTITIVKANSLPNLNAWLKPIMEVGPIAGLFTIIILVYLFYSSLNRPLLLEQSGIYFFVGLLLFGLLIPYFGTLLQGNISDQNAQIVAMATYNTFTASLTNQLVFLAIIAIIAFVVGYVWRKGYIEELTEKLKERKILKENQGEKEKNGK